MKDAVFHARFCDFHRLTAVICCANQPQFPKKGDFRYAKENKK
jgi:hypothetical protein